MSPPSPRPKAVPPPPSTVDTEENMQVLATTYSWISYDKPVFPQQPENLHLPLPQVEVETAQVPQPQGYFQRRFSVWRDPKLSLKVKLRSLPLFGYVFAWTNAFIRLAVTRHHHTVELHALRQQLQSLNHKFDQQTQQLNDKIVHLNHRIEQIKPYVELSVGSLERCVNIANERTELMIKASASRIKLLEDVKSAMRLQRYDALDIGERLMKLEQAELGRKFKHLTQLLQHEQKQRSQDAIELRRLLASLGSEQSQANIRTAPHSLESTFDEYAFDRDEFYKNFEDRFRGTRAEIKERLKVYLPYLENLKSRPQAEQKLFIDVGCGRGEWLELLAQANIPSIGIDMNEAMVNLCVSEGLAAKTDDAIRFLWQQEQSSAAGVSGFHIIEHLPFDKLIELFDAAYHALEQGGILIFETPNPENLIIGACNFYYDPTHLHPVVPEVAQFIALQRGFSRAEIVRLHPFPEEYQMPGDSAADIALNKFLFSAQDYAVLAWK